MTDDLFDHAMRERMKQEAPLAARMRPRTLDEYIGQEHIVGEGMALALAGCLLGSPIAWWAARRYVDYKRLGMEPLDANVLVWASAALAGAALLAVLQPALRAAWTDPMKALRDG